MASPEISVSIVSHGHGRLVEALLDDLARQTAASRMEVILTLNVPEDIDLPDGEGAPPVTVLKNDAVKGYGANMNAAAKIAKGRSFCVLNPDIRLPDAKCLETLRDALQARGHAMVAPVIEDTDGGTADSVRANLTPLSVLVRRFVDPDAGRRELNEKGRPAGFFWLSGAFMLFDAASYRAVGGFDPRIFLYCEDYDICARMHLAGMAYSVVSGTRAVHAARRRSRLADRHMLMHLSSLIKVWTSSTFWRVGTGRWSGNGEG